MENKYYQPLLKWKNNSYFLLDKILNNIPKNFNNYYEPFLGGGAVLPNIKANKYYASDIIPNLIKTHIIHKNKTLSLIKQLLHHYKLHSKEYYLQIRKKYNENNSTSVECAGYFAYLNRNSYNGSYRVNKKGEYNSSFSGHPFVFDYKEIFKTGCQLQKLNIEYSVCDYKNINPKQNDFVYFNPPTYTPIKSKHHEVLIKQHFLFTPEDFIDLFNLCIKLNKKVYFMIVNEYSDYVFNLFKEFNIKTYDIDYFNFKRKNMIITNYN